ncbi:MAG: tyrosine-type recombinase/integrase, partial [Planctomycetes bacterium]|nr:tyrosine-type recombinase/integrase [Planctomycetota bacterium]
MSDLAAAGIPEFDPAGRRVDRHALRTTAGTLLARAGVMPQEAQRQMRHADIKTTLRHYTDLRLADQARAVAKLPQIAKIPVELAATGTDGPVSNPSEHPQQYSQHSVRQTGPNGANACQATRYDREERGRQKSSNCAGKSDSLRGRASRVEKAGDRDRTGDIQLGNARAADR